MLGEEDEKGEEKNMAREGVEKDKGCSEKERRRVKERASEEGDENSDTG